jgi:GT2 family glycosyltransferase/serine acetyltransferase
MRVLGVMINYRTAELTARAADALLAEFDAIGDCHLVVIDNDSQDGSLEQLTAEHGRRGWGSRASVVASGHNYGYGYGINVAVKHALAVGAAPDYVYVLNSDAFADPGSLRRMLAYMDAHPEVGLAGNDVCTPEGAIGGAAFRFPTAWSELAQNAELGVIAFALKNQMVSLGTSGEDRKVDWVPGTSMLIRREVFERVGYFDEGFFLYFEEVDFCKRVRDAGYDVAFVADAPVTHIGSVSTGMEDMSRRMPDYWFESRHRYFRKHHGRAYAAATDAAWLLGKAALHAKKALTGRGSAQRPSIVRDFVRNGVRALISSRLPGEDAALRQAGVPEPLAKDTRRARDLEPLELLLEDLATYDHKLTEPGLWAVLAHRLGVRSAELEARWSRPALEAAYRVMSTGVDWVWGIRLPRSVELGRRVRIWHNGCVLLEARAIGNDVHLRHDTTFGPVRGSDNRPENLPVIEDGADIGSGVCVLGDVRIGSGAVIGANSVVMRSVPARATVFGVPARIIPA